MPRVPVDPIPPPPGSGHPAVFVGVLMTVALAILVGGVLWLSRARGGPVYYAELPESPGLRRGGPVLFRGMSVGQVDDIAFTDTSVRITIQLGRDDVPIREGTGARVGRMGILGETTLELVPSPAPSAPLLPPGSTLARAAPDSAQLAAEAQAKAALADMARDLAERRRGRDSAGAATPGVPERPDSLRRP